jgi:hypothetical protein
MPVRSTPIFIQGNSHPAEETRLMLAGMLGAATGSFAGGVASSDPAHGVARGADLAVTQNGTPNMSVNVAAGGCFIRGTQSANQGAYHLWNDATLNVAIAAADATNPRRDLIIAQVRDLNYSGADKDARIVVVTGTPAASPVDPTVPANALVLARVAVAAGDTSIVTAEITDLRTMANIRNQCAVFGSTTQRDQFIPVPYAGQQCYLATGTRTEGLYTYTNGAWREARIPVPGFSATKTSAQTVGANAFTVVTFNSETYDHGNVFASNTFTVPAGYAGKWLIVANLAFGTLSTGANKAAFITRQASGGGTPTSADAIAAQGYRSDSDFLLPRSNLSVIYNAAVGDLFKVCFFHDGLANVNVLANAAGVPNFFQATWLGT